MSGAIRRKTSKRVKTKPFHCRILLLALIITGTPSSAFAGKWGIPSISVGMTVKEATSTTPWFGFKTVVAVKEFDSRRY
jgi:hypothetical protein